MPSMSSTASLKLLPHRMRYCTHICIHFLHYKTFFPERPALDLAVLPSQLQGQGGGETSICAPVHLPLPHHCHSCAALLLRPHQLGGSVDFWILQVCAQLRDCPLLSLLPSLARSLLQTAEPVRGASHCNRTRRLAYLLPLRSSPG